MVQKNNSKIRGKLFYSRKRYSYPWTIEFDFRSKLNTLFLLTKTLQFASVCTFSVELRPLKCNIWLSKSFKTNWFASSRVKTPMYAEILGLKPNISASFWIVFIMFVNTSWKFNAERSHYRYNRNLSYPLNCPVFALRTSYCTRPARYKIRSVHFFLWIDLASAIWLCSTEAF